MDRYNPMDEDQDELDVLTGTPLKPNTPRDPDDPREKLRSYLAQRAEADKRMATPEYRQAMRAPQNALQDSNRDLALSKLFMNAANQAGTIGGKAASSQGFDQFAGELQNQNAQTLGRIDQERAQMDQSDDRRMKIMQYLADKRTQQEQNAVKGATAKTMLDLKERSVAAQEKAASAKENKETGANEGLKALDRDYAKDYNDWTSTGKAGYDKNLGLLREAQNELKSSAGDSFISGNMVGRLPDALRSEKSRVIQQKVQAAAQGAMKAALGSAFTEKEGARIMNLSYDPTLSPEQNIAKINDAIADLEQKASNQQGKARFFEKGQTLKGYTAPAPESASNAASSGRTEVKRQYSPSRNQTRIIYSDGTQEVIDGKG